MNPIGLYLHIPFCVEKCGYCNFYSIPASDPAMDEYLDALLRSIKKWAARITVPIATIYLGGGTPTIMGAGRLTKILTCINQQMTVLPDAEITLEANPNYASLAELTALRAAGFNRISIGVQTGVEGELKNLSRKHTVADAENAIKNAFKAGFENISADLMLGIPAQTLESMEQSVKFLAGLNVNHISAYILKIEEGTPFYDIQDCLYLPDEAETAQIYTNAVELLESLGYMQYEISNFAKPGFESRHNLLYWLDEQYLGIGPAAHSFLNGIRFAYKDDIKSFILGCEPEKVSEGGDFFEYAMLRLRLAIGLNMEEASHIHDFDRHSMLASAEKLSSQGLCVIEDSTIRLTKKGMLFSNYCIGELLF